MQIEERNPVESCVPSMRGLHGTAGDLSPLRAGLGEEVRVEDGAGLDAEAVAVG